MDFMFDECQRRLNAHLDRLKPMIAAKNVREAVAAYYRAIPWLEGRIVRKLELANGGSIS